MIDLTADTIDTRDIIARIDELESDHTAGDGEMIAFPHWADADRREWQGLTDLINEIGDEAPHGVTLVRDRYFRDYIREWYADTWGNPWTRQDPRTFRDVPVTWEEITSTFPFSCIDWDRVAEECRSGYSVVEVDGVTYFYA